MIKLTLPYPPTINHYYGRNGNRSFIKPRGKQYRVDVACIMLQNRVKPLSGVLQVVINAYMPDKRKRDADNILKSVLDALHKGDCKCYEDDSQIEDLRIIKKGIDRPDGKIEIMIKEMK